MNLTGAGVAKESERIKNGKKLESEREGEQEGEPARRESLEKGVSIEGGICCCEGRVENFCWERKLQLQMEITIANANESKCKPLHSISHL